MLAQINRNMYKPHSVEEISVICKKQVNIEKLEFEGLICDEKEINWQYSPPLSQYIRFASGHII